MRLFLILISVALMSTACTKKESTEAPAQTAAPASQTNEPAANTDAAKEQQRMSETKATPVDLTPDSSGLSKAVVTIETTKGTIQYKFYPTKAPMHVARMVELIQQNFYNGIVFHRVEPNFVIQTGDPTGTGRGGSGKKLQAEFSDQKHLEGTVAMARAQDPNSGDSQFYICLKAVPFLDKNYTVFGQVTSGMDVVKQIQVGDKMTKVTIQ